jgi:hypothetical protein
VKDLELNADECIRMGIADEIYITNHSKLWYAYFILFIY